MSTDVRGRIKSHQSLCRSKPAFECAALFGMHQDTRRNQVARKRDFVVREKHHQIAGGVGWRKMVKNEVYTIDFHCDLILAYERCGQPIRRRKALASIDFHCGELESSFLLAEIIHMCDDRDLRGESRNSVHVVTIAMC